MKVEPGSKAGLADHPWNDIHHTMAAPSANVRFRMPEGVDVGASASKDIRPIASRIALFIVRSGEVFPWVTKEGARDPWQ